MTYEFVVRVYVYLRTCRRRTSHIDCSRCYYLGHNDVECLHLHSCRADRLCQRGALVVEHYRCGGVERAAGGWYHAEARLSLIVVAELYGESLAAECVRHELRTLNDRLLHEVASVRKVYHELHIAYVALVYALEVDHRT